MGPQCLEPMCVCLFTGYRSQFLQNLCPDHGSPYNNYNTLSPQFNGSMVMALASKLLSDE